MKTREIRKAITQAKINESNSSVLIVEMIILAIMIGYSYKSWLVFGGTLIVSMVLLMIRPLGFIICLGLSLFWGVVAFFLGLMINGGAATVIGILVFLIALGIHFSSLEYMNDAS